MLKFALATTVMLFCSIYTTSLYADWSLNLGYRNPISSQFGLNFLWMGQDFGFEFGIGHASATEENSDSSNTQADDDDNSIESDSVYAGVSGDVSVLYFLTSSSVKFYLQGGFGAGIQASAGDNTSAGAGLGGPFAGAGLLAGSKSLYLYLAYVIVPTGILQAGIGFDI